MAITSAGVDSTARAGTTGTTSTISGVTFGTAFVGRVICVFIVPSSLITTPKKPTAVTIGGVTAVVTGAATAGTGAGLYIASAVVPTGTSGSVVCTFASSDTANSMGAIALTGAANATPSASFVAQPGTGTINVSAGGSVSGFSGALASGTWTGINANIVTNTNTLGVGLTTSFGSLDTAIALTAQTIAYSGTSTVVAAAFTPAGSVFSVSVAESATAADTTNALSIRSAAITESASASDTPSATFIAGVSITEFASAADIVDSSAILQTSVSESATIADSVNSGIVSTNTIVETTSAMDAVNSTVVRVAAIAEVASASDATSNTAVLNVFVAETSSVTDQTNAINGNASIVAETLSATDVTSANVIYVSGIIETNPITDTTFAGTIFQSSIVETDDILDRVNFVGAFSGTIAEFLAANDLLDATVTTHLPTRYVRDLWDCDSWGRFIPSNAIRGT